MNWKPFNVKEIKTGDSISLEVRLADKRKGCIAYEGIVEEIKPACIQLLLKEDGDSFLVDRDRIHRMK